MSAHWTSPVSLPLCAGALLLVHCAAEPPPAPVTAPTPSAAPAPVAAPTPSAEPEPAKPEKTEKDAHARPPHWSYSGDDGVSHWGDLAPDYSACKMGASQSPVDIVTTKTLADAALTPLKVSYPAVPLQIFNNGH